MNTPTPSPSSRLLELAVTANLRCIAVARRVGVRTCDDSPEWRAAEREANGAYDLARADGWTAEDLFTASRLFGEGRTWADIATDLTSRTRREATS